MTDLTDLLASAYNDRDKALQNARYQLEDAIDVLEGKWDDLSVGLENGLRSSSDTLKHNVCSEFDSGIDSIRDSAKTEIRPMVQDGFAGITEAFNEALDMAEGGFLEVLMA